MNFYAGIGSRETPKEILEYFKRLGAWFAKKNFVLRSGHAPGADRAFEIGCTLALGRKEIYLPWKGFEGSNSELIYSSDAFSMAMKYHPYWDRLTKGGKSLQARNCHQVLGQDLEHPSLFIVCWTKDGKGEGGTGQAIRIAKSKNIPVFDAGKYETIDEIKKELKDFLLIFTELTEMDFIK